MNDTIALALEAQAHLARRISSLLGQGAGPDRVAFLEALLDYTRRYLAGKRGELGKVMSGQLHYNGIDEDKETNGAVLAFAYAAEDDYNSLVSKA